MLVTNNDPKLWHLAEILTLWPGVNEVDPAQWAEALKIKLVYSLCVDGVFEVAEGGLETFPTPKAVETVRMTFDPKLLAQWEETEKRKPVLNAIAKQSTRMKPTPRPAEPKAEE